MKTTVRKTISMLLALVFAVGICAVGGGPLENRAKAYDISFEDTAYWPVPASRKINQRFSSGHKGLDIGGTIGNPVIASKAGKVVAAQPTWCSHTSQGASHNCVGTDLGTYGNYVEIKNDDGTTSRYGHMKYNTICVSVGQHVSAGQQIGQLGSSGSSTGPHLHFEIYYGSYTTRGDQVINPSAATVSRLGLSGDIVNSAREYYLFGFTDTTPPSVSYSFSSNTATSNKITITYSDNVQVAGFYWGTSSTYTNNMYVGAGKASGTQSVVFNSAGTYYLTVKDSSGNLTSRMVNIYQLSLNANGGSVNPSYVITANANITLPAPSRSGYTFNGWNTKVDGSGTNYSAGGSFLVSGNTTLYAIWSPTESNYTLTVNYRSNYADGATISVYEVSATTDVLVLSHNIKATDSYQVRDYVRGPGMKLTRTGYEPTGYYNTRPDGSGYSIASDIGTLTGKQLAANLGLDLSTGNKTVNLYPQWRESQVLSPAFGSFDTRSNEPRTLRLVPSKDGRYTFEGTIMNYYISDMLLTVKTSSGSPVAVTRLGGDYNQPGLHYIFGFEMNLKAGVEYLFIITPYSSHESIRIEYYLRISDSKLTYNANGGTGAPGYSYGHGIISLSTTKPTRSGYTFLGWSASSSTTSAMYQPGDSFNLSTNTTLYAVWKINTYSVSYNANGGTGAPGNQTKTYGQTLTLSSTKPTRSGYTFKNWNTKADGTGTSYAAGASYTANAAVTLYAQWTKNASATYTLTYNANGGTGAPAAQTGSGSISISSTKPTRSGYIFKGWATSASATAAQYQPGASYSLTANATLYAVWQKVETPPATQPTITIRNFTETIFVDYKTTVTFVASEENAPANAEVHWFINGSDIGVGGVCTMRQATASYTVQCKLIGANGTVLAESEIETVQVNTGFFARIIAFFRQIFGSLPVITQAIKETL